MTYLPKYGMPNMYVNDSRTNEKITELMQAILENDLAKEIIIKMKPSNGSK